MSESPILTPLELRGAVWSGELSGWTDEAKPDLVLLHGGEEVTSVDLTALENGNFLVEVRVPDEAIADGAHVLSIAQEGSAEALVSFTLIAGDALRDNVRSEVALLRAELDMLKRSFRQQARRD